MHDAPPVSLPLRRSSWLGAVLVLLWLLGLAVTATWFFMAKGPLWAQLSSALIVLVSAVLARRWWLHSAHGHLSFDSGQWQWSSSGGARTGVVLVHLDWQDHLLLEFRCRATAERYWFWFDRLASDAQWADLRRAVYSRPNVSTLALASTEPQSS